MEDKRKKYGLVTWGAAAAEAAVKPAIRAPRSSEPSSDGLVPVTPVPIGPVQHDALRPGETLGAIHRVQRAGLVLQVEVERWYGQPTQAKRCDPVTITASDDAALTTYLDVLGAEGLGDGESITTYRPVIVRSSGEAIVGVRSAHDILQERSGIARQA